MSDIFKKLPPGYNIEETREKIKAEQGRIDKWTKDNCSDLFHEPTEEETMEELITEFIEEMRYWFSMEISSKVMTRLLKKNPELIKDTLECGLDTCSREWMADIIGKYVVGEDWPIGGDTEEYTKSFYQTLLKKAPRKGIKVSKDAYKEWVK